MEPSRPENLSSLMASLVDTAELSADELDAALRKAEIDPVAAGRDTAAHVRRIRRAQKLEVLRTRVHGWLEELLQSFAGDRSGGWAVATRSGVADEAPEADDGESLQAALDYLSNGYGAQAQSILEKLLAGGPSPAERSQIHCALGHALLSVADYEGALEHLELCDEPERSLAEPIFREVRDAVGEAEAEG